MIVTFPLEIEQEVKAKAAQRGLDVVSYLLSLVKKDITPAIAFGQPNGNSEIEAGKQGIREFYVKTGLPFSASPQEVWDKLCSLDQGEDDYDPDALNRAVDRLRNRTPEEREAARQQLLNAIPTPLPIPEGKTIFDMIPRIRGEETEEQVFEALERLS